MEDRTTVVELAINQTDLFNIVQNWAEESKFLLHEKSRNRTIYSRKGFLAKAWLSIQLHENKSMLEAWISSPSLEPDMQGDAWKGWKIALPAGYGYGMPRYYKKQFDRLLKSLSKKATGISDTKTQMGANQADQTKSLVNKSIIAKSLVFLGLLGQLSGASSIWVTMIILNNPNLPDITGTTIPHGALEILTGSLILASSRALAKGRFAATWLYCSVISIDIIRNFMMGTNTYFGIAIGLFIIWQMIELRRQGELN